MTELICPECQTEVTEEDIDNDICPYCGAPLHLEEDLGGAWIFQESCLPIWGQNEWRTRSKEI